MDPTIYLGISGSVVCLDKASGATVWESKLRGSGLVTLYVEPDAIFAYTNGHAFKLDAITGEVLWENGLPGLGYGYATIGPDSSAQISIAASKAADDARSNAT